VGLGASATLHPYLDGGAPIGNTPKIVRAANRSTPHLCFRPAHPPFPGGGMKNENPMDISIYIYIYKEHAQLIFLIGEMLDLRLSSLKEERGGGRSRGSGRRCVGPLSSSWPARGRTKDTLNYPT
jgi:hypothetical protein